MPCLNLLRSVWLQALRDQGWMSLRSSNLNSLSWFFRNLRMFQGRSLCLKRIGKDRYTRCIHGAPVTLPPSKLLKPNMTRHYKTVGWIYSDGIHILYACGTEYISRAKLPSNTYFSNKVVLHGRPWFSPTKGQNVTMRFLREQFKTWTRWTLTEYFRLSYQKFRDLRKMHLFHFSFVFCSCSVV